MTEDDLDTVEDLRPALAACGPEGRDGDLLRLVAVATLFAEFISTLPSGS